ncbi:LigA domain-containing protein [Azospirillaceae bacterium]
MNESLRNLLDKEHENKPLKEIVKLSPSALQGVSERDADLLKQAFNIKTIEEMGKNKFFLWAQALTALAPYEK